MKQTITFRVDGEDKNLLQREAEEMRLPVSAYCRSVILHNHLKNAVEKRNSPLNVEISKMEENHLY